MEPLNETEDSLNAGMFPQTAETESVGSFRRSGIDRERGRGFSINQVQNGDPTSFVQYDALFLASMRQCSNAFVLS